MCAILDGFFKNLIEHDMDWAVYLMMADYFDERGEIETAQAIHWQVREQKRPLLCFTAAYTWYNIEEFGTGFDIESDLPKSLYNLLKEHIITPPHHQQSDMYKRFPCIQTAHEALWHAWPIWQKNICTVPEKSRS